MLWLVLFLSRQYSRVLQHLSQKERLRIIWGAQPRITVVSATAARSAALSRPTSRNSHSRSHSLAGQVGGAAGGEAGADGGASGSATGLLRLVTRRGSRRGGGGAKVGQVWAAWTGPGGEGEGGYERLPEEGPPRVAGRPRRSASGGSSGGSDAVELSPPRRPLSAGGASPHARMSSVDCEEGLTPRHLHSIMVARQSQLLASPLGSVHAGTGADGGRRCACWQAVVTAARVRPCLAALQHRPALPPARPTASPFIPSRAPAPIPPTPLQAPPCTWSLRGWACGCTAAASRCWRG